MASNRKGIRFFLISFWGIVTAFAVVTAVLVFALGLYENLSWKTDSDNRYLVSTCNRCHSYKRPHLYAKAPYQWRKTVKTMFDRMDSYTPSERVQRQRIIEDLLIRHRSLDPASAFNLRCHQCHSPSVADRYLDLPPEVLEMMVRRHVLENNFAVDVWEGEMAIDYLKSRQTPKTGSANSETAKAQVLFEHHCRACHTISFCYRTMFDKPRTAEQWNEIVERMRAKAPDLILPDEVPVLVNRIRRMEEKTVSR